MVMLHLLRPIWPESIVMWCDSGAAYPGTRELMARVAAEVPRFKVVHGAQPQVIERFGFPVDVVPVKYTRAGEMIFGKQPVLFQPYIDCCFLSMWLPVAQACRELGVKVIYRGQRKDETRRSRLLSPGAIADGIRFELPLHDWTREEVFDYAEKNCPLWIGEYYRLGEKTSRDCWNCTAYRDDNVERVNNLPDEQRRVVNDRLQFWRDAVTEELNAGVTT